MIAESRIAYYDNIIIMILFNEREEYYYHDIVNIIIKQTIIIIIGQCLTYSYNHYYTIIGAQLYYTSRPRS